MLDSHPHVELFEDFPLPLEGVFSLRFPGDCQLQGGPLEHRGKILDAEPGLGRTGAVGAWSGELEDALEKLVDLAERKTHLVRRLGLRLDLPEGSFLDLDL